MAAYTRPRHLPPLKLSATFLKKNVQMDFPKILIELRLRDHSVKLLIDRTVPVPSTTSTAMLSAAFATL